MKQTVTKKDLQRDLQSIREDLQLEKCRLDRITTASNHLAIAIQALSRPTARRGEQLK